MGHIRKGEGAYGRLQKRLDRFPIGAPPAASLPSVKKALLSRQVQSRFFRALAGG